MPPIVFNADDRKAVSRRLVKIPVENTAFAQAQTNTLADADIYLKVDHANKDYYDFYQGIVTAYETERASIDGVNAGEFNETDIHNSAAQTTGNYFFPTTAPFNTFLIPKIIARVNGGSATTLTPNETTKLSNPAAAVSPSSNGITQIISILRTGFNDGAGADTTSAIYNPGDLTVTLNAAIVGLVAGNRILVQGAAHSFIAVVISVGGAGTILNIYPITAPTVAIPGGASVSRVFGGFTQAERQALVASTAAQQDILDALTFVGLNSLSTLVANWKSLLVTELAQLNLNQDSRAPQLATIATAKVNVNTAITAINVWQALPGIAVGGRYDNGPLTALSNAITVRQGQFAGRVAEIVGALGSVVDNGDGTFTFGTSNTDIYYKRYQYLNTRINRAFGSLTRAVKLQNSNNSLQDFVDNNDFLLATYLQNMTASQFSKDADGMNKININDASGFSSSDSIYVISETQPELSGVIINISGNIITLNFDVPVGYNKLDLARIFKTF